jgi:microcystin-dependent protein
LAQGTAFSYQGRLVLGGAPASGNWDVQFKLYDAATGTNQVGSTVTKTNVPVNTGLFSTTLDFGEVFDGNSRWLDIAARTNGSVGGYTNLTPRVAILPVPYAINGVPPGTIVAFGADNNVPTGWLLCAGSQVSRTTYARLFATIGTTWGAGNGSNTFHLPDLRAMFLRGANLTRQDEYQDPDNLLRMASANGTNNGNVVGSFQKDDFERHRHSYSDSTPVGTAVSGAIEVDVYDTGSNDSIYKDDVSRQTGYTAGSLGNGGNETRPQNAYVNYIIKY